MITNQRKAVLYAYSAVILWSTVAVSFKISLQYLDYFQLLFISSWTSTFSILIITIYKVKQRNQNIKEIFIQKQQIFGSLYLGFLNPFLYYIVLFKAYSLLPASLAQPLNYTWVIVISIFSILFLKQKINYKQFLALIISFFGVIIIATKGNFTQLSSDNPFGIFLAIVSSIIWGAFWILNMKSKTEAHLTLLYNFFFGSIYISIALFIFSDININLSGIIPAVYVGLFEMGITFLLWFKALKYTENTALIGNIVYLSPFLSLIFISLILGESIHISTLVGLLMIIAGAIFQNFHKAKSRV